MQRIKSTLIGALAALAVAAGGLAAEGVNLAWIDYVLK